MFQSSPVTEMKESRYWPVLALKSWGRIGCKWKPCTPRGRGMNAGSKFTATVTMKITVACSRRSNTLTHYNRLNTLKGEELMLGSGASVEPIQGRTRTRPPARSHHVGVGKELTQKAENSQQY